MHGALLMAPPAKTDTNADDGPKAPSPYGARVASERGKRGWSQAELAARSGVSKYTIAGVELGYRGHYPRREQVVKIAHAFHQPVAEWLRLAGFDVPAADPSRMSFAEFVDTDTDLDAEQKQTLKSIYINFTGLQEKKRRR